MLQSGSDKPSPKESGDRTQPVSDSSSFRMDHRTDELNERLSTVIFDVIERRNSGEHLSDEAVIAAHSDLMPELGEELAGLKEIRLAIVMGKSVDSADEQDDALSTEERILRCPVAIALPTLCAIYEFKDTSSRKRSVLEVRQLFSRECRNGLGEPLR